MSLWYPSIPPLDPANLEMKRRCGICSTIFEFVDNSMKRQSFPRRKPSHGIYCNMLFDFGHERMKIKTGKKLKTRQNAILYIICLNRG
jgi:hypothetical protein